MSDHDEHRRRCRRNVYIGLGSWLALAALTLFGAHGCSPRAVQAGLQAQVEKALAEGGHASVTAQMDGQRALLQGVAPTEDAKRAAGRAALTAAGPGGAWPGGVTQVVNSITVGKPVSPYTWNALRTGDWVALRGHAPTPAMREALVREARRLFPGGVIDEMIVAGGAPAGGNWQAIAADALAQLAALSSGEARLSDARLTLIGEAEADAAAKVRAHYEAGLAPPFTALVDVLDQGKGLDIPELADINLAEAGVDECQTAFDALLRRNVINFDTGSAVIAAASQQLLANLASVSRRCDKFVIKISGHTDNVGERALNMELSQARAAAVAQALTAQGVAPDRLETAGFGPDNPRQPNTTAAGRAANRRIEFEIAS